MYQLCPVHFVIKHSEPTNTAVQCTYNVHTMYISQKSNLLNVQSYTLFYLNC